MCANLSGRKRERKKEKHKGWGRTRRHARSCLHSSWLLWSTVGNRSNAVSHRATVRFLSFGSQSSYLLIHARKSRGRCLFIWSIFFSSVTRDNRYRLRRNEKKAKVSPFKSKTKFVSDIYAWSLTAKIGLPEMHRRWQYSAVNFCVQRKSQKNLHIMR